MSPSAEDLREQAGRRARRLRWLPSFWLRRRERRITDSWRALGPPGPSAEELAELGAVRAVLDDRAARPTPWWRRS